jgi:hypothetical protein
VWDLFEYAGAVDGRALVSMVKGILCGRHIHLEQLHSLPRPVHTHQVTVICDHLG